MDENLVGDISIVSSGNINGDGQSVMGYIFPPHMLDVRYRYWSGGDADGKSYKDNIILSQVFVLSIFILGND